MYASLSPVVKRRAHLRLATQVTARQEASPLHPLKKEAHMALYHAATKPVSRSTGRSSCAAAAYRAGDVLRDERQGLTHDYRKRGDVLFAEIVVADGEPVDRAALWNSAEAAEKRKDARTAREWVLALPAELSHEKGRDLAVEFARDLAARYGVAVDVAIHRAGHGDERNIHAHLLCTTRKFGRTESGAPLLGEKADIELSDTERKKRNLTKEDPLKRSADEISDLRALWAQRTNAALELAGFSTRVDHRSYADQGVDREATFHLGHQAAAMERDEKHTRIGDANREIAQRNAARAEAEALDADIKQAEEELDRLQALQAAEQHDQDAATAAEQRPGIRHPEPPKWQVYRERMLTDAYNRDVAEALGRWVQIERMPEGLRIHNRNMDITDHGDRITAGMGGQEKEIEAMLTLARAKGWERLDITGSPEFREKLGRAALDAGFSLSDTDLQERIMEQRRQEEAAHETADSSRERRLENAFHMGYLERLDDPHNHSTEVEDARNVGRAFTVLAMVKDANANAFAIVESDPPSGSKPLCFRCYQDLHVGQHVRLFVNRDNAVEVVADISPVDRPTESPVAIALKSDDAAPG